MSHFPNLPVRVECHAGHRGEETPRRFSFDGRRIEVVEVVDAWLAPDHRYFKVRGDDGACYILRNDAATARWELTMFDRTGTTSGRFAGTANVGSFYSAAGCTGPEEAFVVRLLNRELCYEFRNSNVQIAGAAHWRYWSVIRARGPCRN